MNTPRRFSCLLVLAAVCGPSPLAASTPATECGAAESWLRPQDQVWLVRTRHLCSIHSGGEVAVARYDRQGWVGADTAAFYAADDAEMLTCVYVHAARVDAHLVPTRALTVYHRLVASQAEAPALRLVIWAWPADPTRRPLQDFRRMAVRADTEACLLGRFLDGIDPTVKLSLIGYSMGPRIITGAMHLLGGGTFCGFALDGQTPRRRVRAVLWAPAVHSDWLWPGRPHGEATRPLDGMLILRNSCDPVLARYAMLERRCRSSALGYVGLSCPQRLGEAAERITTVDMRCELGKAHDFNRYVDSSLAMGATRQWALWEAVGRTLALGR